ncbi:MAG: glycosyltransferase [Rhabdochlamydiaceae bacterium]|nr:glycosyltransferase [Rhabdochlamydiaceae bacterium]
MKILLVTEKCSQSQTERDGGARLVETLQNSFADSLSIMQFGPKAEKTAKWHFDYPCNHASRFERRLENASFIAKQIKLVEHHFTHVIFVHISMQFGIANMPLHENIQIWTFPMFLTPSYRASGEIVPERYFEAEMQALLSAKNIVTPSHMEKRQLVEVYSVLEEKIHVVPRGIQTHFLKPKIRTLNGPPKFCSVGSIKPQKNTLGLIHLFAKAAAIYPGATLQVIGPLQNIEYFTKVQAEIDRLKISEFVEFNGYIPPTQLSKAIEKTHLHLSTSTCETFGRSIFETLALGLPNIARKSENASAEFLEHLPYARFIDDDRKALEAIEYMLSHLSKLSSMATEIGSLYDDKILSRLLVSKFARSNPIVISDFDGTLYHKNDLERTLRCLNAFQKFPLKVLCSARPIHDLIEKLKYYELKVDWIIGSSGAICTDGGGKLIWLKPLDPGVVSDIERQVREARRIEFEGQVLQIAVPVESMSSILGLRSEIYQDTMFISHWEASKLRAVHRLLNYINWDGQVRIFGDGPYDIELLNYFDGTLITPNPINKLQKKEIEYV